MNAWVRYVDGRFLLTWRDTTGHFIAGTRPLTRWEVILWRLFARVPSP